MNSSLKDIDAVILCGGKGERIRSVISDKPKVLASVKGVPLLDILLSKLHDQGVSRFILCVGYLREQIMEHVKNLKAENRNFAECDFVFSEEIVPLGTGGALKNARWFIKSKNFIVINGDTLWSVDFKNLYNAHVSNDTALSFTLVDDNQKTDYGRIVLDSNGFASTFLEKGQVVGDSFISAGIYFMKTDIFSHMPSGNSFSLEYDVFPALAQNKLCRGTVVDSGFLDIGTPERYSEAQIENFS
jgi:D-glycero-alpha-D-manno-heptose 1-phosphate guanylyltransferase